MTIASGIDTTKPAPTFETFRETMRQLVSGASTVTARLQTSTLRPGGKDAR